MSRAESAIRQMVVTLTEIEAKVASLPRAWLQWRPDPQVWSILDNLCHIEEFIPYWTSQIMLVVSHSGEKWGRTHSDADRLAAVEATDSRELVSLLASLRGRMAAASAKLLPLVDTALDSEAVSVNPRWGSKPASFILECLLVQHLASHSRQIQRNIDQLQLLRTAQRD